MRGTDKKILIIAESIDIEDSSGTKGRVALIQNLFAAGFDIQVHHYSRKKIQLTGITCVEIKENRRSLLFYLSRTERFLRNSLGVDIHAPLEKIFGFSFTVFNDRNSIVSHIKRIKGYDPDLIFTFSKGGSFRPHHALLLIPELHDKWVAYIHDPYPMHLYPRPYTWVEPGYNKKYRFIKNMTEKAAFLAFPSLLLKEWMGSYFSGCLEKGLIIPHQITPPEALLSDPPDFFSKSRFNVLHAGTLLWGRDPKGLIKAFQLFIKKVPSANKYARLIFLGGKNHYSDFLSKTARTFPELIVPEEKFSFANVLRMQRDSSVNVILEAKSEISPFLPGKFPHCVQADKPILHLGPVYSETRRLLGSDYKFSTEIDDVEGIAELLEKLFDKWSNNRDNTLDRKDLEYYLSAAHLKSVISEMG